MPLNVIENRQLLYIISMFLLVQFTGLLLASQVFSSASGLAVVSGSPTPVNTVDYAATLVVELAVFSVILVLLFRFLNADKIFTLLEIFVIGMPTFLLSLVLIPTFLPNIGPIQYLVLLLLTPATLIAAKFRWPRLRNVAALIASVGAGLVLGLILPFELTFIFLVGLAIYDFIAVFITKHMITLANAAMSRNMSMMIMASEIEAVPMKSLGKKEQTEYLKAKDEIASRSAMSKSVVDSGLVPLSARTALGTGDLMAPLMLAVSAYSVYSNFTLSISIVVGAVFGLGLTMYTLKRYKRALPAIPFLLFGMSVAIGIFFLVTLF